VRHDSPAVLATAGTLAIHLLLAVAGDALVVFNPLPKHEEAPVVELFDIEPPEVKPPPPPVAEPEPEPEPEPVVPQKVERTPQRVRSQPQRTETPPPPVDTPPPPAGGAPVATMDGIAPSATGIPVARGARQSATQKIGRGGSGTGTGSGVGAGSAEVKPVSVATIKTRAMPKGDFSYFDASKDYPAEAKALGIEGQIRVRLIVDDKGRVTSSVLLNRLGHGLDELALRRAGQIQFEPARDTDDRPVSSVVVWTFNMTLPK
jgi:protein TonB